MNEPTNIPNTPKKKRKRIRKRRFNVIRVGYGRGENRQEFVASDLDEVFIPHLALHLENMGNGRWWLGLGTREGSNDYAFRIWIGVTGSKAEVTIE